MVKKYLTKIGIMVIVVIMALGILSVIPASASKPAQEPIDRVVFIHYPKGFEHQTDVSDTRSDNSRGGNLTTNSCPNPNTCPDYKYAGIHWGTMPVPYVIDPTNEDNITSADIKTAVKKGFYNWSAAEPNTVFTYINSTTTIAGDPTTSRDGLNSVLFRNLSNQYPNALAVTFVWYYRFGKQIVETDTVFNDAYDWSYTDPTTVTSTDIYGNYGNTGLLSYDVGDIVTHEQGHWLMLSDLYKSRDSELTMYGYGAAGEMKKISLGWGDKLGIAKIY